MKGISVIIPCYNREGTIVECINSVISQNVSRDLEVLVCDDGSTDSSLKKVKDLNLPQVKIVEKPSEEKARGASIARNRGIIAAKYDYVCFLDSDDWYLPGYINQAAAFLDENTEVGYTFCRVKKALIKGNTVKLNDWTRKRLTYLDKKYHVLFRAYNINTDAIMVRRLVLAKVGLFDTSLEVGEDSDMWIRISEISKGAFLNMYGAAYRIDHDEKQLTKSSSKKQDCSIRLNLNNIARQLCKDKPDKMSIYLSVRTLKYMRISKMPSKMLRRIIVSVYSIILFPIQYSKFLYYVLFKR